MASPHRNPAPSLLNSLEHGLAGELPPLVKLLRRDVATHRSSRPRRCRHRLHTVAQVPLQNDETLGRFFMRGESAGPSRHHIAECEHFGTCRATRQTDSSDQVYAAGNGLISKLDQLHAVVTSSQSCPLEASLSTCALSVCENLSRTVPASFGRSNSKRLKQDYSTAGSWTVEEDYAFTMVGTATPEKLANEIAVGREGIENRHVIAAELRLPDLCGETSIIDEKSNKKSSKGNSVKIVEDVEEKRCANNKEEIIDPPTDCDKELEHKDRCGATANLPVTPPKPPKPLRRKRPERSFFKRPIPKHSTNSDFPSSLKAHDSALDEAACNSADPLPCDGIVASVPDDCIQTSQAGNTSTIDTRENVHEAGDQPAEMAQGADSSDQEVDFIWKVFDFSRDSQITISSARQESLYSEFLQLQQDIRLKFDLTRAQSSKGLCFESFRVLLSRIVPIGVANSVARNMHDQYVGRSSHGVPSRRGCSKA